MIEELKISGRINKIFAREFWIGDKLVTPFCVVVIQTDQLIWKLFWEDEREQWEVEPVLEEFCRPIDNFECGDELWRYPHIDLAALYNIKNQEIVSFSSKCGTEVDKASLELSDGRVLNWIYNLTSEKISFQIS